MKKTIATLALLAFSFSALAESCWMNPSKRQMRWDIRPNTVTINELKVYENPMSETTLNAGGWVTLDKPDCEESDMIWDFDAQTVRAMTEQEIQDRGDAIASATAQAESDRIATLAAEYGGMVFLLRTRLVQLGHDLPGDSKTILSDVMGRSAAGTLSDAQEVALGKLTDIFILLKGENLTDADINAIWVFIQ